MGAGGVGMIEMGGGDWVLRGGGVIKDGSSAYGMV